MKNKRITLFLGGRGDNRYLGLSLSPDAIAYVAWKAKTTEGAVWSSETGVWNFPPDWETYLDWRDYLEALPPEFCVEIDEEIANYFGPLIIQ
jgi:hypothetical protein